MATFNITTAVNIDTLTSKAGGDTYNINGGYLTIDQDSRYGMNQNTSASLGPVTLSATLGGTFEINATKVRIIPYDTGSGNVPASNTTISQGSASGLLIGVYSALNVAPTTAGSAMPASGYIKIKQWNDVAFTTGALTGIGANATAADRVGWIEIVGDETGLCTCNRLGTFKIRGDYFDLGTTDGVRATTYQIPSSGLLQYHAGVEVETDTGSGVYEFYPCAGSMAALAANIATDSLRGKYCWITSAGVLRFGHDGTNSTGGYIPPTGRKVRIANVFLHNCTTAARTANVLPNATLATRYEFATTGGGVLDIDKASIGWYMNLNQAFSITLTNVGICTALVVTELASSIAWSNVNIGQEAANSQLALTFNLNFAGGTITNCKFTRAAQASSGHYVASLTDNAGFTLTGCQFRSLTKAGNATTGSLTLIRAVDCVFDTTTLGGGRFFMTTCTRVKIYDTVYYDHPAVNTLSAIPMYAFDTGSNCLDVLIDGLTFGGLYMTQPYSGVLNVSAAGCAKIRLRNLGTPSSPLSLGAPQQDDVAWSRVTTTATVTKTAHGLLTNDIIYVLVSSDTGAITVAAKTVTSTPTADTFTFTCTNAGATSGTLTYYGTKSARLVVLATSAAANDVRIQRCYTPHVRTNIGTLDNSSKNVKFENVWGDFISTYTPAVLNGYFRGLASTIANTASTSVYGTHWLDTYVCGVAGTTAGVSWSRSGTTVTVTAAGHNLRTGMLIYVTTSSATTPVPLGVKTVTVLTSSTFTFTGVASGSTSGTLDFDVANGRILLVFNESTVDTADQYTLDSGAPKFTSAGGLTMPTIGDQITFIMPKYCLGVTGFPAAEAVHSGGTQTDYDTTYAIDKNDGNGYSSFKNLGYNRAGAGGSSGSTTVTMTSTTGVAVNDYVFGTNVAPYAKVVSVDSSTNITVSIANIGTVSGILRFNQLPNETGLDPEKGVKLKIRYVTRVTNTNAINGSYWHTKSSVAGRAAQYTLDPVPVSVTVLDAATFDPVSGARVLLKAASGTTVTITRSGSTATVTHTAHGLATGQKVVISGANQGEYNGVFTITRVDADSYTYTVSGTPATPATGTITAYLVVLDGTTNGSGFLEEPEFAYTADLAVDGKLRKGTSAPYYKTAPISGEILDEGLAITAYMVSDS